MSMRVITSEHVHCTLHELDTVYSLDDLVLLYEIADAIDSEVARKMEEAKWRSKS